MVTHLGTAGWSQRGHRKLQPSSVVTSGLYLRGLQCSLLDGQRTCKQRDFRT